MRSNPRKQGWFNIRTLINACTILIDKWGGNHIIMLQEKHLKKFSTTDNKISLQMRKRETLLRPAEDNANIHSSSYHCACWWKTNKASPLRLERTKHVFSYHFYSQILIRTIRQSKSPKASRFKDIQLPLFTNDMILYGENPQRTIKTL